MKQTVYAIVEPITLDYYLTLEKPQPPKSFQTFECDMQEYRELAELQLQRDQLSGRLHRKIHRRIHGESTRGKNQDLSKVRELSINKWINSSMP